MMTFVYAVREQMAWKLVASYLTPVMYLYSWSCLEAAKISQLAEHYILNTDF